MAASRGRRVDAPADPHVLARRGQRLAQHRQVADVVGQQQHQLGVELVALRRRRGRGGPRSAPRRSRRPASRLTRCRASVMPPSSVSVGRWRAPSAARTPAASRRAPARADVLVGAEQVGRARPRVVALRGQALDVVAAARPPIDDAHASGSAARPSAGAAPNASSVKSLAELRAAARSACRRRAAAHRPATAPGHHRAVERVAVAACSAASRAQRRRHRQPAAVDQARARTDASRASSSTASRNSAADRRSSA